MRRRLMMLGVASAILLSLAMLPVSTDKSVEVPKHLDPELWAAYHDRFIHNGRVIDNYQDNISHSEGQGYGMLMAEAAGDKNGFDQLWAWTHKVLQRKDSLFAWRYEHCPAKDASCITDSNNASDGDILIAWALLRAHHRWGDERYFLHARAIADAVAGKLLVHYQGRLFLLPGSTGFISRGKLTLNPSYWIFPALESFAEEFNQPMWNELIDSGKWLLHRGRFGIHHLPADWIELENNTLALSEKFPPRYSYDAVRILLHQAWSETGINSKELAPYQSYWSHTKPPPAWIDLNDNEGSAFSWNTGMAAIAAFAQHRAEARKGELKLPLPGGNDGYYSWSLTLLCRIAAMETAR